MSIALFAFRPILGVIVAIVLAMLVVWFVIRVVVDGVTWFKEEIIDDVQRQKRKAQKKKAKDTEKLN